MKYALVLSLLLNAVLVWALTSRTLDRSEPSAETANSMRRIDQPTTQAQESLGDDTAEQPQESAPQALAAPQGPSPPVSSDLQPSDPIPALPGLAGFDIRRPVVPTHPAELLAAEIEDPGWAAAMEGRIKNGIEEAIVALDAPLARLYVECRMTRCGIVAEHPNDEVNRGAFRHQLRAYLKDEAGISECCSSHGQGRQDGTEFFALYLRVER